MNAAKFVGMLSLATVAVATSGASADSGSSISVPNAGPKQTSISWSGSVPMGEGFSTTNSKPYDCTRNAIGSTEHDFRVSVAPNAYRTVRATLRYVVNLKPTVYAFDSATLVDPSGNVVTSTSGSNDQQELDAPQPAAGTWKAYVCEVYPFDPGGHPFSATVTIATTCLHASPCVATTAKKKRGH